MKTAKTYSYTSQFGGETEVRLQRRQYANGTLAVQMFCEDNGCREPYAVLTVNLNDSL